jgi:hypothetical protein
MADLADPVTDQPGRKEVVEKTEDEIAGATEGSTESAVTQV